MKIKKAAIIILVISIFMVFSSGCTKKGFTDFITSLADEEEQIDNQCNCNCNNNTYNESNNYGFDYFDDEGDDEYSFKPYQIKIKNNTSFTISKIIVECYDSYVSDAVLKLNLASNTESEFNTIKFVIDHIKIYFKGKDENTHYVQTKDYAFGFYSGKKIIVSITGTNRTDYQLEVLDNN